MAVLEWLLVGLAVGIAAGLLRPRLHACGTVSILLAMAGALLFGYLGLLAGLYGPNGRGGLISAALGAVLTVLLFRAVARR